MRIALLLAAGAIICAAQTNPFADSSHVPEGRKLYRFYCVNCHGMDGASGRGARLTNPYRRNGSSDAEVFRTIAQGIAGTEMPGQWLPDEEIWKILTFLRTLEKPTVQSCPESPGDAARGAEAYQKTGCAQCHTMKQAGGHLGPDLTAIGAARSRDQLMEALVDPDRVIPARYRTAVAVSKAGEKIEGILLARDDYSVSLLDRRDAVRTFYRSELQSVERPARSLMPSYRGAAQLEDIAAYLCSEKRK